MDGHIHHVEHHHPKLTKKELQKDKRNFWRIAGSFLLDMLPVIFGILIAVGINGWREKAHEKKLERYYLTSIKKNIDDNVKDLEFDVVNFSRILKTQKFFSKDYTLQDSAELQNHFFQFFSIIQPQFNNTGFITLQNTGKLDIISNLDIINKLTFLYEVEVSTLQVLINDYNQKYSNFFIPYLIQKNTNHKLFDLTGEEILSLTSTPQFHSIVSLLYLDSIVSQYKDVINQHKKLSKEIEEELKEL